MVQMRFYQTCIQVVNVEIEFCKTIIDEQNMLPVLDAKKKL